MDNVIRPTFGKPAPKPEPAPPVAQDAQILRLIGTVGDWCVGVIADASGPEGPALKVVVGPDPGDSVEAVAILPQSPEGAAEAEMVGLAILRTLEILAERPGPASA